MKIVQSNHAVTNKQIAVLSKNNFGKRITLPVFGIKSDTVSFKSKQNILPLNKQEQKILFSEIQKTDNNNIQEGSLGKVYRISLPNRPDLAVKEFKAEYEGRNPKSEADNLKKLPEDCKYVQRFVDLIEKNGKKYLITTYQKGNSLSALKQNMSDELIKNILDELFRIEKSGLVYYDYSMANIVQENNIPGFFDFESGKEQNLIKKNNNAWNDLCHLSRNTFFPATTNIAGFEIRTVGKIISEQEKYKNGEKVSYEFVKRYLKQLANFYVKYTKILEQNSRKENSEITKEAIGYSSVLAKLFSNPEKEIVSIEKQTIRIKELLTEFWFRNDPDLEHDDKLYANGEAYVANLQKRFAKLKKTIDKLMQTTKNEDIKKYCTLTSDLMKKISDKEISYLIKRFGLNILP